MCNYQRHYHEISQSFHIQFFGGWGYILQKYGRRQAKAPGQLRRGRNEVLFLLNFLHIVCLCLCLISPWFSSLFCLCLCCVRNPHPCSHLDPDPHSWILNPDPYLVVDPDPNPESWSWLFLVNILTQIGLKVWENSPADLANAWHWISPKYRIFWHPPAPPVTHSQFGEVILLPSIGWFTHFLRWGKHTAGRKRSANGFRSNYEGGLRIERKPLYSHRAAHFKSTANWPLVCVTVCGGLKLLL